MNKIKRTCLLVEVAVPADHRVKTKKKSEHAWILPDTEKKKKLWNVNDAVIPIILGALGLVIKGLEKRSGKVKEEWISQYC